VFNFFQSKEAAAFSLKMTEPGFPYRSKHQFNLSSATVLRYK